MASEPRLPWAARLFVRLVVPRSLREEVEGDLSERLGEVERAEGRRAARRWLRWQLITLRPWALREVSPTTAVVTGGTAREGWLTDVRLALRTLRLRPGPAAVVVLTVGLAVGATTSVYTVVDGVLLRPLPFPDADRLVRVWQTKESWFDSPNAQLRAFANEFPFSVPTLEDWIRSDTGLDALGAYSLRSYVHHTQSGAEVIQGEAVTSGFFSALAVDPAVGRYLQSDDDRVGAERVVVLSSGLWSELYGGDPSVIGGTVTLDRTAHTIVGVMPSAFPGSGAGARLWTPLEDSEKEDERDSQFLSVVGRLADGVTIDVAGERVAAVQAGLAEAYPDEHGDLGSRLEPYLDSVVGDVRATLWFLLGAVGLVLLVATLNIANVLAVLGLTRRRELAVKSALGAGSGRLMRGLFVESAVLATLGGIAGIGLAWIALPLLLSLVPSSVPRYEMIGMSPAVLVFGLAVTAVTTVLVGTLPAVYAGRARPGDMLRSSTRGTTSSRGANRLRSGMVAAEVALAFVLLVAAGLLANSYQRLWSVERGFETEGLVVLYVAPDPAAYTSPEEHEAFERDLRERFEEIPGVQVTATNQVPLSGSLSTTTYEVEREGSEPEEMNVFISVGLDGYLSVMGIPVIAGRDFGPGETAGAPPVAIVNEALAGAAWPGESPIGKRLRSGGEQPWIEVVGVAANVRHQRLDLEVEPKLYVPSTQSGRSTNAWVLRVRGDMAATLELARRAVAAVSPTTPVRDLRILDDRIAQSVAVPRFRTFFVVALAGMAGLLALIGLYGVVTFAVTQRTREIGVRMALGADADGVIRGVIASGLRLSAAGVVAGVLIALPSVRLLRDFLFDIGPTDPVTWASIAAGVTLVGLLAAALPARRAATVDPVAVLNSE